MLPHLCCLQCALKTRLLTTQPSTAVMAQHHLAARAQPPVMRTSLSAPPPLKQHAQMALGPTQATVSLVSVLTQEGGGESCDRAVLLVGVLRGGGSSQEAVLRVGVLV
jgi:hypothetical protein